jgi:pimeloyl-ACP methyl ester carboxylesterase
MPALARDFTVIAVDQRGMGLTEKAERGYDSATLADDLVALMDALGYERFSVVGLDTGMVISYALAADHPERVARLVVGEAPLPGVTNPPLPGATNPPLPLFLPGPAGSAPLAPHLQPARRVQRAARPRSRGPLLQVHLRRRSHHQADR